MAWTPVYAARDLHRSDFRVGLRAAATVFSTLYPVVLATPTLAHPALGGLPAKWIDWTEPAALSDAVIAGSWRGLGQGRRGGVRALAAAGLRASPGSAVAYSLVLVLPDAPWRHQQPSEPPGDDPYDEDDLLLGLADASDGLGLGLSDEDEIGAEEGPADPSGAPSDSESESG